MCQKCTEEKPKVAHPASPKRKSQTTNPQRVPNAETKKWDDQMRELNNELRQEREDNEKKKQQAPCPPVHRYIVPPSQRYMVPTPPTRYYYRRPGGLTIITPFGAFHIPSHSHKEKAPKPPKVKKQKPQVNIEVQDNQNKPHHSFPARVMIGIKNKAVAIKNRVVYAIKHPKHPFPKHLPPKQQPNKTQPTTPTTPKQNQTQPSTPAPQQKQQSSPTQLQNQQTPQKLANNNSYNFALRTSQ
jgi:hypothetical protein